MWWACAAALAADPAPEAAWVRDPMVALEADQSADARRSAGRLALVAGAELVAGLAIAAAAPEQRAAGVTLAAGGAAHAWTSWGQFDLSGRRHAAFVADLSAVEGRPEAWPALARDLRLDAERGARNQAFATGAWLGVLGAGVVATALERADTGAVLIGVGVVGAVHHGTQWRAQAARAVDFDTAALGVPDPATDQ